VKQAPLSEEVLAALTELQKSAMKERAASWCKWKM